ncbi:MAG: Fe-S protein assembly co-chaperone HscB [Nitrospira sp.]|nr:Fe-S protein assembly co-chaperone HscB [Nitrospira sp.]
MARSMCWHCQSELAGEYFCERCVKVQPVSKDMDYFTCLGLPRRLTIDPSVLEANYYERSRAFHPDFYLNKSEAEQAISLANAATLNTAYRTLKDPIQRAEYLLDLEAGAVKTIRTSPPADLFEEILELQDTLDAYRAGSPSSEQGRQLLARLQHERESLERRQQELEQELLRLFGEWDTLQDRGQADEQSRRERDRLLKRMREILSNRTYIKNIVNDLVESIG